MGILWSALIVFNVLLFRDVVIRYCNVGMPDYILYKMTGILAQECLIPLFEYLKHVEVKTLIESNLLEILVLHMVYVYASTGKSLRFTSTAPVRKIHRVCAITTLWLHDFIIQKN